MTSFELKFVEMEKDLIQLVLTVDDGNISIGDWCRRHQWYSNLKLNIVNKNK